MPLSSLILDLPESFFHNAYSVTIAAHVPGADSDQFRFVADAHDSATLIEAYWESCGLALSVTSDDGTTKRQTDYPAHGLKTRKDRWVENRNNQSVLFPSHFNPATTRDVPHF